MDNNNELIGYAIYFKMYDMKLGLGFYLDDLFIRESYRRKGIGTILWKKVANDCLDMGANYMQWIVLAWNTSAFKFYFKFNAVNLTKMNTLNFYYFLRFHKPI